MKTLKDKLTASVRQAKEAAPQPAAAAPARKAQPPRAAERVPKPVAPQPAAPQPAADKADAPLPASRAAAPAGFTRPDQVWPD